MKTYIRNDNEYPELRVFRLQMSHPGDLSQLAALIESGTINPAEVAAVIGKTEGNGGVNDFTRGYFTQSLFALLSTHTGHSSQQLQDSIPCILSGGTEGVLSPHYLVFVRTTAAAETAEGPALALGKALSPTFPSQDIGRWAHVRSVADAVRAAMDNALIEHPSDVAFVQVKCPCITSARVQSAEAAGHQVLTADASRSMAYARAAGAFGVALALGQIEDDPRHEAQLLADFSLHCSQASISSGVEVSVNEVVLLGHSRHWKGPLRIACEPMQDALDLGAVMTALQRLGLNPSPQISEQERANVAGILVKCEPDRRGHIRGIRHTMLDDIDINAQRHVRGALGGLVAGVIGHGQIFVSGGAEHQGPDGGGLIAVIAAVGDKA